MGEKEINEKYNIKSYGKTIHFSTCFAFSSTISVVLTSESVLFK